MLELLNQMDGFDSMGDVKVLLMPMSVVVHLCKEGHQSMSA